MSRVSIKTPLDQNPAHLAWVVPIASLALFVACTPRDSAIYALSISPDGTKVFYISDDGTGSKLFFIDVTAVDTTPKQLDIDRSPIEVVAGEGNSFVAVTRRYSSRSGTQRWHYTLAQFFSIANLQSKPIIESDIYIGSVAEVSDGIYAFQLGTKLLPSGRSVRQFFTKTVDGQLTQLSKNDYGYKVSVSVILNNLVFLSGKKDPKGNEIPDIIPLEGNAKLPIFLEAQSSPNLEAIACNRSATLCFSQHRYTQKGQGSFSHQLVVTNGVDVCKPDIPHKWIEFPNISESGNAIAFLTTNDGVVAAIGSGHRKVIVLKPDMSTCKFEIQQINL